ncbi:MAG: deoxyribonuclease [Frankiales bacterium]|nr:deoxyribonuclease [Frankiales bacterium]
MPPRKPSPVGAHVFTAGGLATTGLAYARRIKAAVMQVFVTNPRGWAPSPGDPRQDERLRDGLAADKMPLFLHAPYLVNLGSPAETTRLHSAEALRHALVRGRALGAAGIVFHGGSAVSDGRRDEAMAHSRELLLPLLDFAGSEPDGPRLLVEPTAGGGGALAAPVDGLAEYVAAHDEHPGLGVCLDTCHLFAAGHDLSVPGGMRTMLTSVAKQLGRDRLGLVHANDSKDVCGSLRDRHQSIGRGLIGADPFGELFRHPVTRGVPVLIETPGTPEDHARDLELLRELRDR